MTIEILSVPCLEDNFAYLVRDEDAGRTALVDAPEAAPILAALDERGWSLHEIWLTHHHADHVQAVPELRSRHDVEVVGGRADASRLPPLDRPIGPNATLDLGSGRADVLDVPGHTVGHMAFHLSEAKAAFTADSLMAMGCGRLFEGTPEQMWSSLGLLAALPEDTVLYTGHDYMETNLRFAASIEPDNAEVAERAERDSRRRAEGRDDGASHPRPRARDQPDAARRPARDQGRAGHGGRLGPRRLHRDPAPPRRVLRSGAAAASSAPPGARVPRRGPGARSTRPSGGVGRRRAIAPRRAPRPCAQGRGAAATRWHLTGNVNGPDAFSA